MYLVTFEDDNGIWTDSPEGFDSLKEAEEYTVEFQTALLLDRCMAIYSCDLIKTVERSPQEGETP